MRFLFELGNMDQLQTVLKSVLGVSGVFEAHRMLPGEGMGRKRADS